MKSFQLSSIEEAGDLSAYDCVFLGFWIEGGTACEEAANVLRHLTNRHIFLFATLAADPGNEFDYYSRKFWLVKPKAANLQTLLKTTQADPQ